MRVCLQRSSCCDDEDLEAEKSRQGAVLVVPSLVLVKKCATSHFEVTAGLTFSRPSFPPAGRGCTASPASLAYFLFSATRKPAGVASLGLRKDYGAHSSYRRSTIKSQGQRGLACCCLHCSRLQVSRSVAEEAACQSRGGFSVAALGSGWTNHRRQCCWGLGLALMLGDHSRAFADVAVG